MSRRCELWRINFQPSDEQKDIRREPQGFTGREVKDFTQEWYIREKYPRQFPMTAGSPTSHENG
jgi:hypothetical protein